VVDECEAPSHAASKSHHVKGASTSGVSTSDQAENEKSEDDKKDLFLEALLHPSDHAKRLLEIRTRVAVLCHVFGLLQGFRFYAREILEHVVASFTLLQDAGLMQNSLILLADDPARRGVIRAVEIDVIEIVMLERWWRSPDPTSYDTVYEYARNFLLGMLGPTEQYVDPRGSHITPQNNDVKTFVAILALATASYAGSHCHAIGEELPLSGSDEPPLATRCAYGGFTIRSCRFACLDQYIGGPVWVFGRGGECRNMALSITKEQFDDLWGPMIALTDPSNSETLAFQTEGGFLSKAMLYPMSILPRENESLMHWTPAAHGCRSLPPGVPLDSFIDLNAVMLIGFGEHDTGSSSHEEGQVVSNCFRVNQDCKLNIRSHQRSIEACKLEYVGTSARQWTADTKAVNLTVGWSGSSLSTNRTWKLRPATTWKEVMLLYCARPGKDIVPLMQKRVGFEWSICTGNVRRVSLFDALLSAFPREQENIMQLSDSIKRNDEPSR